MKDQSGQRPGCPAATTRCQKQFEHRSGVIAIQQSVTSSEFCWFQQQLRNYRTQLDTKEVKRPMKNSDGVLLVTSKEFDALFSELASYLDSCSSSMGGYQRCPLEADSQAAYDTLMKDKTHYRLSQKDMKVFKAKFNSLSKQLALGAISYFNK